MTEYATTITGLRVQVLDRHMATIDCRVCGGDGLLDHDGKGGDCEYCDGTGKERKPVEFAKVGMLEGHHRGRIKEFPTSALRPDRT